MILNPEALSTLEDALEKALESRPVRLTSQHGGMICQAFHAELKNGESIFLKTSQSAPASLFSTEANSLKHLRVACAGLSSPHHKLLHVPEVLAVNESPAFLALEFIPESRPHDSSKASRDFGTSLAAMHRESISLYFGWHENNFLGRLPQANSQHNNWIDFYRECRLLPQIKLAKAKGVLPVERECLVMEVFENLEKLLADFDSHPSLLHGDLWSGNYFFTGQSTCLFDPACYYGDREMDVAYSELFGGFAPEFYEGYNAEFPLSDGYEKRKPLHQLYHLLNHLNHFGEGYGATVEAVCNQALCRTS